MQCNELSGPPRDRYWRCRATLALALFDRWWRRHGRAASLSSASIARSRATAGDPGGRVGIAPVVRTVSGTSGTARRCCDYDFVPAGSWAGWLGGVGMLRVGRRSESLGSLRMGEPLQYCTRVVLHESGLSVAAVRGAYIRYRYLFARFVPSYRGCARFGTLFGTFCRWGKGFCHLCEG
ncbi:hypothetical protein BD414DRAFT_77411 [Trametes punicea]|nr:hypothetical protein BD414DRAFT_77411 [Trametes punicea]